jgi:cytochrome c peroxidase
MHVRSIRIALAGVAAAAVATTVAVAPWQHDATTAKQIDPHAPIHWSKPRLHRLLAATEQATQSTSRDELVANGRALFRSNDIARTGESCQSCHTEGGANADIGTIVHPRNPTDFKGARDPLALWNVSETAPYLWSGTVPSLTTQTINVIKTFFKAGATQPDSVTGQQAAAIVAYMATIKHPVSPFDLGTMSDAAKRGQNIFEGKGQCKSCHTGTLLTDQKQHDDGVPPLPGENDPGANGKGSPDPNGFDTPTLRDIANTGPYMHNGSLKTLQDVVDFYSNIGPPSTHPVHFSPEETADVIAFLKSL